MKKLCLTIPLFMTACVDYKTPPLPDLDAKSFSYEEIMQQRKDLESRVAQTKEELGDIHSTQKAVDK